MPCSSTPACIECVRLRAKKNEEVCTAGHRASISVRYRGGSPISSFGSNRGSIRPRYRAFENRGPILGKARYRGQRTKCGSYQKLMTGRSRSCLSSCWQTDSLAAYERCKIRVGYALEDTRWIRIGYTLDTRWICVGCTGPHLCLQPHTKMVRSWINDLLRRSAWSYITFGGVL